MNINEIRKIFDHFQFSILNFQFIKKLSPFAFRLSPFLFTFAKSIPIDYENIALFLPPLIILLEKI